MHFCSSYQNKNKKTLQNSPCVSDEAVLPMEEATLWPLQNVVRLIPRWVTMSTLFRRHRTILHVSVVVWCLFVLTVAERFSISTGSELTYTERIETALNETFVSSHASFCTSCYGFRTPRNTGLECVDPATADPSPTPRSYQAWTRNS